MSNYNRSINEFKTCCYLYTDAKLSTNTYVDESDWLYKNVFSSNGYAWLNRTKFQKGVATICNNSTRDSTMNKPVVHFTDDDIAFLFDEIQKGSTCRNSPVETSLDKIWIRLFCNDKISADEFSSFFNTNWTEARFNCVKDMFYSLDSATDGMLTMDELRRDALFNQINTTSYRSASTEVISFGEFKRFFIGMSAKYSSDDKFISFVNKTLRE